jgi:hypothetical protein
MRLPLVAVAVLLFAACTPAPPPPLPAVQLAKGTRDAAIALPAQAAALKAKLRATSVAQVQERGAIELRVYANERECSFDQIVREPPMGPGFRTTLHCDIDVPANTAFTFRAVQADRDATTSSVELEASYAR